MSFSFAVMSPRLGALHQLQGLGAGYPACSLSARLGLPVSGARAKHGTAGVRATRRTAAPIVSVNNRDIPEYDLSNIPDEFFHLRFSNNSGPKDWVRAIGDRIGHSNIKNEGKFYLITFHGMGYKVQTSTKRDGFHMSHKKYLLNVLAHMGVFGDLGLKS